MFTQEAVTALTQVARAADHARAINAATYNAVQAARGAGASWTSIGNLLGMSKQAAAKRYTPRVEQRIDPADSLF